jgi:hypothetical protein
MKYIIANIELVKQYSNIDTRARRKSSLGKIIINDKDLTSVMADTFEDKLAMISGVAITEFEAINELNKEVWK